MRVNWKPEQAKDAFTAIVFVERRCSASVLFHLLKLVTQCDAQLDFIRPLFTMGQAAGRGRAECPTFNVKQVGSLEVEPGVGLEKRRLGNTAWIWNRRT